MSHCAELVNAVKFCDFELCWVLTSVIDAVSLLSPSFF